MCVCQTGRYLLQHNNFESYEGFYLLGWLVFSKIYANCSSIKHCILLVIMYYIIVISEYRVRIQFTIRWQCNLMSIYILKKKEKEMKKSVWHYTMGF